MRLILRELVTHCVGHTFLLLPLRLAPVLRGLPWLLANLLPICHNVLVDLPLMLLLKLLLLLLQNGEFTVDSLPGITLHLLLHVLHLRRDRYLPLHHLVALCAVDRL